MRAFIDLNQKVQFCFNSASNPRGVFLENGKNEDLHLCQRAVFLEQGGDDKCQPFTRRYRQLIGFARRSTDAYN
jgi:hypothetical protein